MRIERSLFLNINEDRLPISVIGEPSVLRFKSFILLRFNTKSGTPIKMNTEKKLRYYIKIPLGRVSWSLKKPVEEGFTGSWDWKQDNPDFLSVVRKGRTTGVSIRRRYGIPVTPGFMIFTIYRKRM